MEKSFYEYFTSVKFLLQQILQSWKANSDFRVMKARNWILIFRQDLMDSHLKYSFVKALSDFAVKERHQLCTTEPSFAGLLSPMGSSLYIVYKGQLEMKAGMDQRLIQEVKTTRAGVVPCSIFRTEAVKA